jgi:hypothetical protein
LAIQRVLPLFGSDLDRRIDGSPESVSRRSLRQKDIIVIFFGNKEICAYFCNKAYPRIKPIF